MPNDARVDLVCIGRRHRLCRESDVFQARGAGLEHSDDKIDAVVDDVDVQALQSVVRGDPAHVELHALRNVALIVLPDAQLGDRLVDAHRH